MLAAAGRWDKALAACVPAAFEGTPRTRWRGRAARILWRQGKGDDAVRLMTRVVAECPNYYWAWGRLAEWHRARETVRVVPGSGRADAGGGPTASSPGLPRRPALPHQVAHRPKGDLRRAIELPPTTLCRQQPLRLPPRGRRARSRGAGVEVCISSRPATRRPVAPRSSPPSPVESPRPRADQYRSKPTSIRKTAADHLMECDRPPRDAGPLERALGVIDATAQWARSRKSLPSRGRTAGS